MKDDVTFDHWRTRIVVLRQGDEIEALVKALRATERFSRIERRPSQVIIVRRTPIEHARDPLSAQIHALDLLYRNWPEGQREPGGVRAETEYRAAASRAAA